MADAKITDLPDGGDPQDTDDFVVARGATNNKIAWSSMSNAIASGQVAIAASDTTYTSGTVVLTGAGGGVTVGSNAGQQAVISVAAPVAQTVQTQNVVDVTLSGNTAGALALISSGTMTLAGGNNITLSQAGNAVTISGPNIAGAQTGISGIANSETTYTSGTVSLSELGAITIRSTTGQQFQFSVNPQSVQPETQTFIAGISASDTLYTSGNVRFTGSQAATVRSGTGQLVVIDVPAQSVQPETQTFVGGIAGSNTTYTSGTVLFTGVGGGITVSSNTGQRIDLSVAAQSVQPETQTFVAGISASDTLYTSGNVRFTGSQAVTVRSGTGQLVVIDAPAQSVQPETQTFIAGISASDTLYTSGNVRFTGVGGGVTVSSNTGQRVDISVAAQTVQTQNRFNLTLSGNSTSAGAGFIEVSSGTLTLAGGNNITLSQNGNAVTISGANVGGAQTAISGIANSETTYTSGTVSLSELGAITIRSTTGNQFQLSVDPQSVQPETQTFLAGLGNSQTTYTSGTVNLSVNGGLLTIRSTTGQAFQFSVSQSVQPETQTAISGIANSQTTYTSGTVSLSELGAITIRSTTGNQFQFSVNAQTTQTQGVLNAGLSTGGNTSGDTGVNSGTRLVFVGSNNITLSQGTAANATTITVSGPATHAVQTGISGIANSETTYTSGTVSLSELGAITIRSTTGNQFQLSVNAQTTQTQGILLAGVSTGGNSSGDTGVASGTRLVFAGGNNITLSQGTAANATTITISAGAGGAGLSAGMSTNGNTSGDTGFASQRLALIGGNNITLSGSTNGGSMSITVSAPNLGAGAMSAGVSTGGNTAGATGITGTQLVLVGTGPISLSQTTGANGGTVSINAPATSSLSATGILSISTNGSTISAGVASTSFSGTGNANVVLNGSTVSIGVPHNSAAAWENFPQMQASLFTNVGGVSKTPFYWVENLPQGIEPKNIAIRVSMVTANSDLSMSVHFGVYTFVNSTSVALLGSGSDAFHVSSGSSVSLSGQRNLVLTSPGTVTAISSLTPGNYLFGMMFSATATNAMNASIYAASVAAGRALGRIMPGTNQLSTGTSQGIAGLYGRGSTTVNALPANVQASEIVNQGSGASAPMRPWIFIRS